MGHARQYARPLAIATFALVALTAAVFLPEWRQVLIGGGLGLLGALLIGARGGAPSLPANTGSSDPATNWHERLDLLPNGLACWNAKGALEWSNQAMLQLLGLSRDELAAQSIEERFAPVMQNLTHPDKGQDSTDTGDIRFEILPADGPALLIHVHPTSEGARICTVRDITTCKELAAKIEIAKAEHREMTRKLNEERAKAEAASRSKTAFLAHLSHDIRTPLNHIIGFADLIGHQPYGPIGDDRYASYITDIKNSGDRLLSSFSQIFELAEMEAGNTPMRHENILAADLFARLADRFGERARKVGVELHMALPAQFSLEGDSHCLLRMMGNLVDNALKFTRSGGRVSLAAWAAEDGVVLEVSDTGIGISQSRLALLAEPHLIGEAAFDVENGMPGFGLAIARGIAELSGGSLVIDSTPMVGTTVAVALPRSVASTATSAAA
ncbi:MAG: hypothetical protein GXP01_04435 [Alphaproteobacteria bacterium]|nr:hypothetical protein [Alphaproteobacteria bacterium]